MGALSSNNQALAVVQEHATPTRDCSLKRSGANWDLIAKPTDWTVHGHSVPASQSAATSVKWPIGTGDANAENRCQRLPQKSPGDFHDGGRLD